MSGNSGVNLRKVCQLAVMFGTFRPYGMTDSPDRQTDRGVKWVACGIFKIRAFQCSVIKKELRRIVFFFG